MRPLDSTAFVVLNAADRAFRMALEGSLAKGAITPAEARKNVWLLETEQERAKLLLAIRDFESVGGAA